MGLDIVIPGANFRPNNMGYANPVPSGCLGFYILSGGSLAVAAKNFAGPDAVPVGSPTVQNGFLNLKSQSKYLDTGFLDPAEGTVVCVGRMTDTGADLTRLFGFVGKNGGVANGFAFGTEGPTSLFGRAYYSVGGTAAGDSLNLTGTLLTNWNCLAYSYGAGGQALFNLTAGTTSSETFPTGAVRVISTVPMALGGPPSSPGFASGSGDIAFAGIWNRRLTLDEIKSVHAKIKPLMASFAIPI